jgi:hypothetical protein
MMTQGQLLEAWLAQKSAGRNFYRLEESRTQEFEYTGPRMGHPSNFAAVQFRCEPADELMFQSAVRWSEHMTPSYCANLERAIEYGIIDSLMSHLYPYRGCTVTLIGVSWDDVSSSEAAFYRAAKAAMDQLISTGTWRNVYTGS